MKVISASGTANLNLGPFFDVGRTFDIRLQAVIENPNPVPVGYLPKIETILDIDVESDNAPFKSSMPQPLESSAKSVTVQAVGVSGKTVEFNFSNPSEEKIFRLFQRAYSKGIWQWWGDQLIPAP